MSDLQHSPRRAEPGGQRPALPRGVPVERLRLVRGPLRRALRAGLRRPGRRPPCRGLRERDGGPAPGLSGGRPGHRRRGLRLDVHLHRLGQPDPLPGRDSRSWSTPSPRAGTSIPQLVIEEIRRRARAGVRQPRAIDRRPPAGPPCPPRRAGRRLRRAGHRPDRRRRRGPGRQLPRGPLRRPAGGDGGADRLLLLQRQQDHHRRRGRHGDDRRRAPWPAGPATSAPRPACPGANTATTRSATTTG